MTLFVPLVLTEDEAKAVANAAAYTFTKMAGLVSPDHPVFTGALRIEEALRKAHAVHAAADITEAQASASDSSVNVNAPARMHPPGADQEG